MAIAGFFGVFDVLVIAGLVAWFYGYRRGRAKKPQATGPVCPCTHVWGEHKEGLACLGQVKRPYYSSIGTRNGYEYVRCVCTKYHGPAVVDDKFFFPGTYTS